MDVSSNRVVVGWGRATVEGANAAPGWRFWLQPYFSRGDWYRFEACAVFEKEQIIEKLQEFRSQSGVCAKSGPEGQSASYSERAKLNKSLYQRQFEEAQHSIQHGELQKVVLYSCAEAAWDPNQHIDVLMAAIAHKELHPYGFWQKEWGWIGATPEVLFEYQSPLNVRMDALAGTVPLAQKSQLLTDEKLMREQQIVVDDIRAQTKRLGLLDVDAVEIYEKAPLAHRRQKLNLKSSSQLSWDDLVDVLHPTAAVGGLPRASAELFLKKVNEEIPRRFYGAPFGVSDGREYGRCLVGLRGIYFSNEFKNVRMWVGGGVTSESKLEHEWDELNLKTKAIRNWLNI